MNDEATSLHGLAPGTVHLTRVVNALPQTVWKALSDPAVVQNWFGNLSASLQEGGSAVLDFGDGDFFTLQDVRLTPPQRVQYTWRFLGIGPAEVICWHLEARGNDCAVTVTDTEDERSGEMAVILREGWQDFLGRLDRFLTTGMPARYDWRRELDGSIALSCNRMTAWERLMGPAVHEWLHLEGKILESGANLILAADQRQSCFEIGRVKWRSPNSVSFEVRHHTWSCPTRCQLWLSDRGNGSCLSFSHIGWEGLTPNPQEPPRQRRRFSRFWIEALTRARQCCESSRLPASFTC